MIVDKIELHFVENELVKVIPTDRSGVTFYINGKLICLENSFAISSAKDLHGHLLHLGKQLLGLDLTMCKSAKECAIKAAENKMLLGDWKIGRGWNEVNWDDRDSLNSSYLDKFCPSPTILIRIDGHAAWINSSAMNVAGINNNTPNPEGGFIVKDDNGIPTGILIDNAIDLVTSLIPNFTLEQKQDIFRKAIQSLITNGISHLHDMDVQIQDLELYKFMARTKEIPIKLDLYIRGFDRDRVEKQAKPEQIGNLTIKGLKFYADGALGSRGALLFEPYSDDNKSNGLKLIENDELFNLASQGIEQGFEIAVHAIGDKANHDTLNIFEKLRSKYPKCKLRIEHAQVLNHSDLLRFKELDVKAYIQPIFSKSDNQMAQIRLGERVNYAYPLKRFFDAELLPFYSTDFPIETHNPFVSFSHIVDYQSNDIYSNERISKKLAWSMISNYVKFSLETILTNDFMVIDRNIFTIPHEEIKETKVIASIFQNKLLFVSDSVQ